MLVLTSSGFLTQTLGPLQDKIINSALHAGVVINSLDAKGLYATTQGGDSGDGPPIVLANHPELQTYRDRLLDQQKVVMNDPLTLLAEGTGGRFFHNSNDLGRGFREMAAVPEVSYVLGFSPENLKSNGKFHALKVILADRHEASIQARPGYYAPSIKDEEDQSAASAKRENLERAVMANTSVGDIPIAVNTEAIQLESDAPGLKVMVHVDVKDLPYERCSGRNFERLIIVTALFDENGQFLTGAEGVMDLALKDATRAEISGRGIDAVLSLAAPPGIYRLRDVVEETGRGHLSASSKTVEIY